jgi:hypothetical protein
MPLPADPQVSSIARGKAMGVEHAVLFRAHDLHAPSEFFNEAMQD